MPETEAINDANDTPESPNISNGVAVYNSWEEMLQSWQDRATALADEMNGFGFASFWLAGSYDKLQDGGTANRFIRRGNYYTVLGVLTDAANDMMNPRE